LLSAYHEIVQESYNDFKRAQRRGETIGRNKNHQLKMTSEHRDKEILNHNIPLKQNHKHKRPIQNSLDELL
jgi:hypothetical protein